MIEISGHIVDVKNQQIFDGIIMVDHGRIYNIKKSHIVEDQYVMPGFIDSHVHIESTMLLPENFAKIAARHGTVGVVADPHEIGNVLGVKGVEFMIESARKTNFHFCFCAPSCVPATNFETVGHRIDSKDIALLLQNPEIYGLAEMMNYPGVIYEDPEVLRKIEHARKMGKPIDGHAPGVTGDDLRKYASHGISTDHECTKIEDARERLEIGMKIAIRDGSAARNFDSLAPLLNEYSTQLMFCTDDKNPDDLLEGHIDDAVRRALKAGYPLWNVLNAACLTPIQHYKMPCGLLQKGDSADFVVIDNLQDVRILKTYIAGEEYPSYNSNKEDEELTSPTEYPNYFNARPIKHEDIRVPFQEGKMRVLVATDGSLFTDVEMVEPLAKEGLVLPDVENDVLKLVVYNRYSFDRPRVAFIRGFGLKDGAIGSSIAHDNHNIIAVGTNDEALAATINLLIEMKGGISVCEHVNGQFAFESLPLPVAGLMSPCEGEIVARQFKKIKAATPRLGCSLSEPFMLLSFMALTVIPRLKLTDKGLFDSVKFEYTELFEK